MDIGWLTMGKRSRFCKQFKLDMAKYEDKKNPCYNCIVKGICTDRCNDFYIYDRYLCAIGNMLLKEIMPKTLNEMEASDGLYSVGSIALKFLNNKDRMFIKVVIKNTEVSEFLKMSQCHIKRIEFITANHHRKYGYSESRSSSSISSSYISTPSVKNKNIIPTKQSNFNQPIHQISKPLPLQHKWKK